MTHNNLVSNVTDYIDTLIETRMVRFIVNCINHSNNTFKNKLRVKLLSVNSTFAANYQYLSYKYGLIEADWFTPLGHLIGKVKKKMLLLHPQFHIQYYVVSSRSSVEYVITHLRVI